ncbi:MAG: hypothetical protein ACREL5_05290 [Gemmatimonadales bacterium]
MSLVVAMVIAWLHAGGAVPPVEAHRYWLWTESATPISVVVWRAARPTSSPLRLRLDAWDSTGAGADSTWTVPAADSSSAEIVGVVSATGRLARDCWRLTLAAAAASGACARRRDDGPISLSDLVPIDSTNGVTWGTVMIAATDTVERTRPAAIYYQVRSDARHEHIRTSLTLTDITDVHHGQRVTQFSFEGGLAAGVNEFARALDLSRVEPGRYLLELQVGDLDGAGASVRSAEFVIR